MSEPRQLTGLDSFFLYAETPRTPMEVSSLSIYDPSTSPSGKVRFKEILAVFAERLQRARVFTRKLKSVPLSLDHPYWVDDPDFDIEHHVRHIALPKPGDWRQLMIQVSRLQSFQLDHDRPLWEAYVIEGLDNIEGLKPGCFAIFMKMHHATVDGASGIALQRAIHDFEPLAPDVARYEPRRARAKTPPTEDWALLRRVPFNTVRKTLKLATGLALATPGLARAALAQRKKPRQQLPRTVFNQGRATAGRVVDARIFSLDEVKAIARAAGGTTVNDVVLGVVGGAMRRYLQSLGRLPDETLVAGVPINVRDEGEEGHDNMVSMMAAPLCTDIADPVERLHAIHAGTQEAKSVTDTIGASTLTQVPMNLPAPAARLVMPLLMELGVRTGTIQFNTIVTNVPGVQQPIYLAGAQMMVMLGMGPVVDQAGIFHAVFSYNGSISFTITGCREMLPDPEAYAQCLEDAYLELRTAVFPDLVPADGATGEQPASSKAAAKKATQKKATQKKAAMKKAAKEKAPGKKAARKKASARKAGEKTPKKRAAKKKVTRKKATKKAAGKKKATAKKAAGKKPTRKKATTKKATKKATKKKTASRAAPKKAARKKAARKSLVRRTASSTPAPDIAATPVDVPATSSGDDADESASRRKKSGKKTKKLVRRVGGDD